MTPDQAKKLLPLIQAFAEGKTIQYRVHEGGGVFTWRDCIGNGGNGNFAYPTFHGEGEYRIKPSTIKVRRYLYTNYYDSPPAMAVCNEHRNYQPEQIEKMDRFLKWIDNNWVEVEV